MSKLDYFTIAIVAICVIALGLLIFRVIKLTGDQQNELPSSELQDEYDKYFEDETSTDDTYVPSSDNAEAVTDEEVVPEMAIDAGNLEGESHSFTTEEASDAEESVEETTSEPEEVTPTPSETEVVPRNYTARESNQDGDFLVIAGSFSVKDNAEKYAEKLRSLGYTNTTATPFNKGKINVVLVDRYAEKSQADAAVRELKKAHGLDAYVKERKATAQR